MREFCKHCQKITPSMKTLNGKEVCVYCEEQKNKGGKDGENNRP